jgi:hypothetical protein
MTLIDEIRALGNYLEVRELEDGTIVGIGLLMFTTAIYMDMDRLGWGRRFCFKEHETAVSQFQQIQSGDDEPVGWIAQR